MPLQDTIAGLETQVALLMQEREEKQAAFTEQTAALQQELQSITRRFTVESTKSYELAGLEARYA